MNTLEKKQDEYIEKLRERSKSGYLSQIHSTVAQIKATEATNQNENMEELISSILDE